MAHGVVKNADGSVAVVHLTPKALEAYIKQGKSPDEAVQAEVNKLQGRGDLPVTSELKGKNIALPADREFRNAWGWLTDEPKVDIDPVKAQEVTKNKLRAERAPLLQALDVEFQRATESNDEAHKAEVVAKKQTLRDVTATVPAPPAGMVAADETYLNQLKAVKIPEEAKPRK